MQPFKINPFVAVVAFNTDGLMPLARRLKESRNWWQNRSIHQRDPGRATGRLFCQLPGQWKAHSRQLIRRRLKPPIAVPPDVVGGILILEMATCRLVQKHGPARPHPQLRDARPPLIAS